eukprot:g10386.t1
MSGVTGRQISDGQAEGGGMSYSESDSDDDNSLASAPRSSNAGSPPGASTGPKLRRKLSRKSLFRRRRPKADALTSTAIKGAVAEGGGITNGNGNGNGAATSGGSSLSRPSSVSGTASTTATTPRKKGLFRRRRSGQHEPSSAGTPDTRPISRSSSGVGISLSDTDTRRHTAVVAGTTSSSGHGYAGRRLNNGGAPASRSTFHGSGGIDHRSFHGGGGGSSRNGGGGGGGKEASLYPAPQPLHRIRSTGAAEEGMGLSQDPNFFPPIPLADGDGSERPSSRGEVRYGDYIRLWGYSSYASKAGYVGYLRRTNKKRNSVGKGELFVLPPVPSSPFSIFHECCFKIVDPQSEKEDGDVLHFGEEISLVDDRGMVWNNKDGRLHGRLGPSLFGNGGHMQLKLHKRLDDSKDDSSRSNGGSSLASPEAPAGKGGAGGSVGGTEAPPAILYGDTCEMVAKKVRPHREGVVRAPVTHFRRRHQIQLGGYLRSDGKGFPCAFTIHHAPPRISMVSVYSFSADGTVADTHTHYKIPWNQELEFELPVDVDSGRGQGAGDGEAESPSDDEGSGLPVLRVNLSNGGEMALRSRDVKACDEQAVWFDVMGLPDPYSVLAASRRPRAAGDGGKDKKTMSMEVLTVGSVLVAFSLVKALMARAPSLLFSWDLPVALEIVVDVAVSVAMVVVVLRQKELSAALTQRPERSTSVRYIIKLIKCEVGAAQGKPTGDDMSGGGEEDIPPMPDSFLLAECGDYEKAYTRWKATVLWRQESGANEALATPHPRFDLIKKHYPTYFHGKDKTGAVVYYEQLGKIDDEVLRRLGLDAKQMLWHYMYQMVYLWTVINPNDADRVTTVLDLKGVTLATATKADTVLFVKQCVTMMSTHYPERSKHLLLLSWPRWFDWIFRFIRPLLNETTKSKMTSCTEKSVYETLLSKIDNDQIPKEYGGASEYALGEHPYEVAMRDGAVKVLQEKGIAMEPVTG